MTRLANDSRFGGPRLAGGHSVPLRIAVLFALAIVVAPCLAASFTPGNLVVYRVGTGTEPLVSTGNPVYLDEYTPGGVLVQSIPLPTTVSGSNQAIWASGVATSEGLITRSADGRYLIVTGYTATSTMGPLADTSAVTIPRVIGVIDAAGQIDTSTALSDFADENNPRSGASVDGESFWVAGGSGGVRHVMTRGATTSEQLTISLSNVRQVGIFAAQLYASSEQGTDTFKGVHTIGSGLPTSGTQLVTRLPGLTDETCPSSFAFYFADLNESIFGVDTLYIADEKDSSPGGIQKFSLVDGAWVSNGSIDDDDDYRGFTAKVTGSTVTLFATREGGNDASGGGELVTLTDTSGHDGTLSGNPTKLVDLDSSSNMAFRGVALTPESPSIVVNSSTTPRLHLAIGYASGVIDDPTDPAATSGIDFTIYDPNTPIGSLIVSASSSNPTVVPNDGTHLVLTGTGDSRNLKIVPAQRGYSIITTTVENGTGNSSSFVLNHAVSDASATPSSTIFVTGAADGSTAIAVDSDHTWVANDEDQVIRLYERAQSGWPVTGVDFTPDLGLTDIPYGVPREVDIEGSTRVGSRIYWIGSQSNATVGDFDSRPNRNRLFATDMTGSGAASSLTYVGRYDYLREDLIDWDVNNDHGLGANHYGLAASAASGVSPKLANGYNIEGLAMAPGGSDTAYVAFRAPQVPPSTRGNALIVPVLNFPALAISDGPAGSATFGAPIELDLGGRGIRSIEGSPAGMLIVAGPADDVAVPPSDFMLFVWSGHPMDAPIPRLTDLTGLRPEGIVELPSEGLVTGASIQFVSDLGALDLYGDGIIAKALPTAEWKKSRIDTVTLGEVDLCYNVICEPLDECHVAGVCNPETGSCSNPPIELQEVTELNVDGAMPTQISWSDMGTEMLYDVVSGLVGDLHLDGGTVNGECLAGLVSATAIYDSRPNPPAGVGHYYMVRTHGPCGPGPYGFSSSGAPRVPAGACP